MTSLSSRIASAFAGKGRIQHDPMSVARRRMYRQAARSKGTSCPCCGQFVKVYRRPLYHGMALFLIVLVKLYRNEQRGYLPREVKAASDSLIEREDEGKLEHWDLVIRKKIIDPETGGRTYLFEPTPKGMDLVDRKIVVPDAVFLLHNVLQAFSTREIDIGEALDRKFDYDELMRS